MGCWQWLFCFFHPIIRSDFPIPVIDDGIYNSDQFIDVILL